MILFKTRVYDGNERPAEPTSSGMILGWGDRSWMSAVTRRHLIHWAELGSERLAQHILAMHRDDVAVPESLGHIRERATGIGVNGNTLAWLCRTHLAAHEARQ